MRTIQETINFIHKYFHGETDIEWPYLSPYLFRVSLDFLYGQACSDDDIRRLTDKLDNIYFIRQDVDFLCAIYTECQNRGIVVPQKSVIHLAHTIKNNVNSLASKINIQKPGYNDIALIEAILQAPSAMIPDSFLMPIMNNIASFNNNILRIIMNHYLDRVVVDEKVLNHNQFLYYTSNAHAYPLLLKNKMEQDGLLFFTKTRAYHNEKSRHPIQMLSFQDHEVWLRIWICYASNRARDVWTSSMAASLKNTISQNDNEEKIKIWKNEFVTAFKEYFTQLSSAQKDFYLHILSRYNPGKVFNPSHLQEMGLIPQDTCYKTYMATIPEEEIYKNIELYQSLTDSDLFNALHTYCQSLPCSNTHDMTLV